jgi:hypothetical protein
MDLERMGEAGREAFDRKHTRAVATARFERFLSEIGTES